MSDQNEDGYKAMSAEHQPEEKEFALPATGPRRVFAVATLGSLGLIHFWILLSTPPAALIGKVFLLTMGAVLLFGAYRVWVSTRCDLVMTAEDIREDGGRILCRIDDIHHVQRGAFAFKPSNGFVIVLNDNMPSGRGWAPGLWWRLGRRIGVGGVTSPGAGKAMADVLAARVVHRRLDEQSDV
jgi:hypothetical protein